MFNDHNHIKFLNIKKINWLNITSELQNESFISSRPLGIICKNHLMKPLDAESLLAIGLRLSVTLFFDKNYKDSSFIIFICYLLLLYLFFL